MRNLTSLILIFCLLFAFDAKANSVTYDRKLNFGKLVPTAASGSLTINTAGATTSSSGVQIIQSGTSAMFDYEASGLLAIISLAPSITVLQSSVVLTSSYSGAPNITINNFTTYLNAALLEINLPRVTISDMLLGGTVNFTGTPRGTYTGTVSVRVALTLGLLGATEGTIPIEVTFLKPLGIVETTQMKFGAINVTPSSAGAVRLTPTGVRTIVSGGGLSLASNAGVPTAGSFSITGEGSQTVNISLPSTTTLSNGSGGTVTLSNFSSSPSGSALLNSNGDLTLSVGADVNISTGQQSGTYNGTYTIQVNY
ncbi:MAG: DUF4402 domain-containing protein [Alphaproteobacteria bacterium]